ncbi:algn-3 [Pristionchus pacificus]|nr:algn-3 [Pristionchus pacificus]
MVSIVDALFGVHDLSFQVVAILLWIIEAIVSLLIVKKVPYTEIDWSTYMQQVALYDRGERNYSRIEGDTGPCVYPGGHLVLFNILSYFTNGGKDIRLAQYIFVAFYLINLALVFRLYYKSKKIAPFVLIFLTLTGYRIHSIFVLRLFNDPLAMMLFYVAANCFISQKWFIGCIIYSVAVSIKMNVLLFAPALFFLLLTNTGYAGAIWYIGICGLVQLFFGISFLARDPWAYITRSFDLSRVFLFKWTVNWRFLPEDIFLDKRLHLLLLFLHLSAVLLFAIFMWFRTHGGLRRALEHLNHGIRTRFGPSEAMYALFTSNLMGIVFARSLHYQFYSWYFHQLPFLLFYKTRPINGKIPLYSIGVKSLVLLMIEFAWNVYPSTVFSSSLLHIAHIYIIVHLILNRDPIEKPAKSKLF